MRGGLAPDRLRPVPCRDLSGLGLNGTLSDWLMLLPDVESIDLSDNFLSGPLPADWRSETLDTLLLSNNSLTGMRACESGSVHGAVGGGGGKAGRAVGGRAARPACAAVRRARGVAR